VIGDKSDILLSFINLTEILSTPVAFLTLNLSMTLDTNVRVKDVTIDIILVALLNNIELYFKFVS
jgi:hypothetical protein